MGLGHIQSRQASHSQSVQVAAADEKWLNHIQIELAMREWKFDHILSKHVGHVGAVKLAELRSQNAAFLQQIDHILSVYVDLVQVEVLVGHIRWFEELSEPSSHTQSELAVVHIQFESADHIQFAFAIRDQLESVVRNQSEGLGRNQSRLVVAVRMQSESTDRSQSLSAEHVRFGELGRMQSESTDRSQSRSAEHVRFEELGRSIQPEHVCHVGAVKHA